MKGLRKILKMTTTYIDRANTNKAVYEKANEAMNPTGSRKPIKRFSEAYADAKAKRAARLVATDRADPMREISFKRGLQAWTHARRRVGAPKAKWATNAIALVWDRVRESAAPELRTSEYNPHSQAQERVILEQAAVLIPSKWHRNNN